MTLPVNYSTGAVTGHYIDDEGTPLAGETIIFMANARRRVDQAALTVIIPIRHIVELDVDGSFSINLPATNDADVIPIDFTYTVIEVWPYGKEFNISVPSGSTLDMSSVVSVDEDQGTVITNLVEDLDDIVDSATRLALTAAERSKLSSIASGAGISQLASTISNFQAAVESFVPIAPTAEGQFVAISADIAAVAVDTLNIDLISGAAVTVTDVPRPTYVFAYITVHHSVANAVIQPLLAKTVPAPTTILDSINIGFLPLTTIGSKGKALVIGRIPANTPCTVQFYLSGTGGNATITAQNYYQSYMFTLQV
jgi:hypothetical protein